MAKELIYKVRIDYDAGQARKGGQVLERSQEQAEQQVNKTTSAIRRQEEASESASQSQRNFQKATSNANQTLFSFGDALNDAQQFQFGFASGARAIGNNIGFMAEQFSNVTTRAGGFTQGLKALGSSLLGPGGIILAINAVVTVLTVFGDSLFGNKDSVAAKAEEARKELEDLRREINRFDIQFQQLTELQEKAFEDLDQTEALKQQVQFARNIEATLSNRLETTTAEVDRLQKQVDLLERIEGNEQEVLKAQREGLITRQTAEGILQGELDITGTLIQKQNQLDEAKIEQESLEVSINSAQEKQIQLQAKIFELAAGRESATFQALQNLASTRDVLNTLANIEQQTQLSVPSAAPGEDFQGSLQSKMATRLETIAGVEQQITNLQKKQANARTQAQREAIQSQIDGYKQQLQEFKGTQAAQTRIQKLEARNRLEATLTGIQAASGALEVIFSKSKGVAIASAIIDAGAAIVRQFKDLPFPAALATSALIAAKTAKQIADMKKVEPGDEGNVSVSGGGAAPEGFTSGRVGGSPRGSTRRDIPGDRRDRMPVIEINGVLPDTEIYARSENGKKQRLSNTRRVSSA